MLRLPRVVRRLGRRLGRSLAWRNLVVMAVLAVCVVLVLGAVMGPPGRGNSSYRTAPVLRAMGVPDDESRRVATAWADIPSLSVSPRFVLPLVRDESKRRLVAPPPKVVAALPSPAPVDESPPAAPESRPAAPPAPPPLASLEPAVPPPLAAPESAVPPPAIPEPAPPPLASLEPALPPPLAAPESTVPSPATPEPAPPSAPAAVAMLAPPSRPAVPPPPPPEAKAPPSPGALTTAVAMTPMLQPRTASRSAGAPILAIVVDDLGPAVGLTRRAIGLPVPVTLAFLPYADDLDGLTAAAQRRGHEIFLHLPMEPIGTPNPGPNAILVSLGPDELERRLAWAFERVPRATGFNNHMGSRATSDPGTMLKVLQEARRHGLSFVDSRTSPLTVGYSLAGQLGIPHAARDVFLDNDPSAAAILRRLAEAEHDARRRGHALAIGHPYPTTLGVLETWLPAAEARGLRIATASELIARTSCRQPEALTVSACSGGDCPLASAC